MKHRKRLHQRKANKQRKIIILSLFTTLLCLSVSYSAFSTNINLSAKGNLKDKSRTIQSWSETSNEDFHTDFYRANIISVTFLDSAIVPNNAAASWDVSETKDKGVMACVIENNSKTGKYDLYIGAKGGVIANEDSSYLFYTFCNIISINFNDNFNTSHTLNMNAMFGNLLNDKFMELETINFGNKFDTSNVINMQAMFARCYKLTSLDLRNFNTSNVTNMYGMFYGCNNLINLDLSNFDTKNVTMMNRMFLGCTSLTNLDLSNFNTSKVTDMEAMFSECSNLENLNISNFDTSNVISMGGTTGGWYGMFAGCYSLIELNLYSFDTSKVTDMSNMFYDTEKLKNIYVSSKWTTQNANITDMFTASNISSVTTGKCSNQ